MSTKTLQNARHSKRRANGRLRSDSSGREPADRVRMEDTCLIDDVRPLANNLRSQVIGQEEALDSLICSFSRLLSGLRDPSRPLLTALLLGPTGVGKTETAKALAQTLFGSERAMIRVNGEEYAHGHELSKLLGSPPGYVGHNIQPLLSQDCVDGPHRRFREESMRESAGSSGLAEKRSFPLRRASTCRSFSSMKSRRHTPSCGTRCWEFSRTVCSLSAITPRPTSPVRSY